MSKTNPNVLVIPGLVGMGEAFDPYPERIAQLGLSVITLDAERAPLLNHRSLSAPQAPDLRDAAVGYVAAHTAKLSQVQGLVIVNPVNLRLEAGYRTPRTFEGAVDDIALSVATLALNAVPRVPAFFLRRPTIGRGSRPAEMANRIAVVNTLLAGPRTGLNRVIAVDGDLQIIKREVERSSSEGDR